MGGYDKKKGRGLSSDNVLWDCSFKMRTEDTRIKQTTPHHTTDRWNTYLTPMLLEMTTSYIFSLLTSKEYKRNQTRYQDCTGI